MSSLIIRQLCLLNTEEAYSKGRLFGGNSEGEGGGGLGGEALVSRGRLRNDILTKVRNETHFSVAFRDMRNEASLSLEESLITSAGNGGVSELNRLLNESRFVKTTQGSGRVRGPGDGDEAGMRLALTPDRPATIDPCKSIRMIP